MAPPSSATRLRQIALVTRDLDRAKYLLTTVLGTEIIFEDPAVDQWGLKNFLVAIGGDVIEVVAPFKPGTTAGRLLDKRGDGGYMIIMQTLDAAARREYIESRGLSKVVFSYSHGDVYSAQYHPKGISGGMMPELDSHTPSPSNPTPLETPFSPWHACGSDYAHYSSIMERNAHLSFISASCHLGPEDSSAEDASKRWEELFGIPRHGSQLSFTNMRLDFVKDALQPEGLESITLKVKGKQRFENMLAAASREGLCGDGWTNILGVKWYFVLEEEGESKL